MQTRLTHTDCEKTCSHPLAKSPMVKPRTRWGRWPRRFTTTQSVAEQVFFPLPVRNGNDLVFNLSTNCFFPPLMDSDLHFTVINWNAALKTTNKQTLKRLRGRRTETNGGVSTANINTNAPAARSILDWRVSRLSPRLFIFTSLFLCVSLLSQNVCSKHRAAALPPQNIKDCVGALDFRGFSPCCAAFNAASAKVKHR